MLFHDDDILDPRYLDLAIKLLNKHPDLSLITTRYTEFFDNNIPEFAKQINDNVHIFKTQKDFAQFLYYNEIVAYATAIYKTEYLIQCPIEYEKFNKFNDWPFMVKMASFGKSAIFADQAIFHIRRHSGQDTWTNSNTPTIEQIINWDLFFKKALNANNNFISYQKFIKRYKHFLLGKYYAFLSSNDRNKYSADDIIKMASKMGIEDFNNKYIKNIYNMLTFIKKTLNFIFSIYNKKEHKIIKIFGIKIKFRKK